VGPERSYTHVPVTMFQFPSPGQNGDVRFDRRPDSRKLT
jgi:hypothetical protein